MIEKPQITQSQQFDTAVIPLKVPASQIQEVMGPAIQEVLRTIGAQGLSPCGPLFTFHPKKPDGFFDFEVGIPIKGQVKPSGRVQPGRLPSVKVVRTVYQGGYEGLAAGWGEFEAWIKAEGLEVSPNLCEFYIRGPESGPDSSRWRTELNRPVIG